MLVRHFSHLLPGTVLDVACGQGRNSLWLCRQGFRVTGIDISDEGLRQADQSARSQNLPLEVHRIDLEDETTELPSILQPFDNIIIINYKPTPEIFRQLPLCLHTGGLLLFCTFNIDHHKNTGFPKKFCIHSQEMLPPPAGLELVFGPIEDSDNGHREIYLFRRTLPPNGIVPNPAE